MTNGPSKETIETLKAKFRIGVNAGDSTAAFNKLR